MSGAVSVTQAVRKPILMPSTASSTPGPNAPLSDGCGNSTQPLANAYAAVASWTSAGMPANQIPLGVPAWVLLTFY